MAQDNRQETMMVTKASTETERLREGVRRLAEGRCDCDVSHLGGHDYGCSTRSDTVEKDDLWKLLEDEEPTEVGRLRAALQRIADAPTPAGGNPMATARPVTVQVDGEDFGLSEYAEMALHGSEPREGGA